MSFFHQTLKAIKKFVPFGGDKPKAPGYNYARKTQALGLPKLFTSKPGNAYDRYLASLHAAAGRLYQRYALERKQWANRPRVKTGSMVRVLPGGRHAMFESNIGLIRKPYVV